MKTLAPVTENAIEITNEDKTKNEMQWEMNHAKISNAIMEYVHKNGTMPSKSLIASATGLSRITVLRHLQTYTENEAYQTERQNFGMMTNHVIAQMLRAALNGDLKAAKMFLEASRHLEKEAKSTVNNYIQINNTVINQQVIQQLKPQQLKRIEQIVAKSIKVKEG